MALVALTLDVLKSIFSTLDKAGCKNRRVLSLGYPDILANPEQIRQIFGEAVFAKLDYRDDSAAILRWHGAERVTDRVTDAKQLFFALGYELEVIDMVQARGEEIIHDLNDPIPENLHGRYGVVIDAGTLEHCFNIGQAAKNVAAMVCVGGMVMHGNPLNMYNHGFYNLNPTWYYDFYEANGFAVEFMKLVNDSVGTPKLTAVSPYGRFGAVAENTVLLVVARRVASAELRWPIQKKYRDNPTLAK